MNIVNEVDEIRWQMAQIRRELHQDVSEVVTGVGEVMDWRSVLRSHPWISVGAALAAGYLVAPRRRKGVGPDSAEATPEAGSERPWLCAVSWGLDLVKPIAMQAIQVYAAIWIENRLRKSLYKIPPTNAAATPRGRQADLDLHNDVVFTVPNPHR